MKATQEVEYRTPAKENAISLKTKVNRIYVRSTKQLPLQIKRLFFKREKAIKSCVKSTITIKINVIKRHVKRRKKKLFCTERVISEEARSPEVI